MNAFLERIAEQNPDAKSADGYDDCIIGIATPFGAEPVLAYDRSKVIKTLMERDGMSREEADEFFEFNIAGAWVGEGTPVFIDTEV